MTIMNKFFALLVLIPVMANNNGGQSGALRDYHSSGLLNFTTALAGLVIIGFISACGGQSGTFKKQPAEAAISNLALGTHYFQKENLRLAQDRLNRSIVLQPRNAETHTMLALVYDALGERKNAEEHFTIALKLDPKNPMVHNNYGVFLCAGGDMKEAEHHFKAAYTSPVYLTPEAAYTNAGNCKMRQSEWKDALQYFSAALELKKYFPEALIGMARTQFQLGHPESSKSYLDLYLRFNKPNADTLDLQARLDTRSMNESGNTASLKNEFASNHSEE